MWWDAPNGGWQDQCQRLTTPTSEAVTERALAVAERVVDSARELLLETGGPSFTVPDLAKRRTSLCDSLYSYFSGKDEVLLRRSKSPLAPTSAPQTPSSMPWSIPLPVSSVVAQRPILRIGEMGGRHGLIFFREAWRLAEIYPEILRSLTDPSTMLLQRELDAAVAAGIVVSDDTYRDATNIRLFVWARIQAMQVGWDSDFQTVADDTWEFCSRACRSASPAPRSDLGTLQDVAADAG